MSRFNNSCNQALGLAPSLSLLLTEDNNNSNYIHNDRDCDKTMRSEVLSLPKPRPRCRNGYSVNNYPVIEPIIKIKPHLPPKPSPRSKK